MCTVSFLPVPGGGYLLATNRDERPQRGPAEPPTVRPVADSADDRQMMAPTDSDAGGTWVAVDDRGRTLCLLNGDGPTAVPRDPDAPSRGLLLLELMAHVDPAAELEDRRLRGALRANAFKLVIAEPGDGSQPARSTRLEWDGERLTEHSTDGAALAISSGFDPEGVAAARGAAFRDLTALPATDVERLGEAQWLWHARHTAEAPDGDANGVCMHREDACTVSRTAVAVDAQRVSMTYQEGSPCAGGPVTHLAFARS